MSSKRGGAGGSTHKEGFVAFLLNKSLVTSDILIYTGDDLV